MNSISSSSCSDCYGCSASAGERGRRWSRRRVLGILRVSYKTAGSQSPQAAPNSQTRDYIFASTSFFSFGVLLNGFPFFFHPGGIDENDTLQPLSITSCLICADYTHTLDDHCVRRPWITMMIDGSLMLKDARLAKNFG